MIFITKCQLQKATDNQDRFAAPEPTLIDPLPGKGLPTDSKKNF